MTKEMTPLKNKSHLLVLWFFLLIALLSSALSIHYDGIIEGGAMAMFLFIVILGIGGLLSYLVARRNFRLPLKPAAVLLGITSIFVIGYLIITINKALKTVDTSESLSLSAYDFQLTAYNSVEYALSEYRGSIVILHFWASWGEYCEDQGQVLQQIWNEYHDKGVEVFGITYFDTEAGAKSAITEWGITFPNGPDLGSRISTVLKVTGVPETLIFTQESGLAEAIRRPATYPELAAILDRMLEK